MKGLRPMATTSCRTCDRTQDEWTAEPNYCSVLQLGWHRLTTIPVPAGCKSLPVGILNVEVQGLRLGLLGVVPLQRSRPFFAECSWQFGVTRTENCGAEPPHGTFYR